jgi:phenylacetate-coenzyme A ligase PaaK-like adenylate-forming protein
MELTLFPRPQVFQPGNLDEWVRHVVDIHFHPKHGTPFWIEREKELGIDARHDIRSYADLALLGFFPIDAMRTRNVLDFVPAALARDPGRIHVHETGGTTGSPSRIPVRDYFKMINGFMLWYLDEVVGFPRTGNWLFVGPSGPHGIAESTINMAKKRGGICYLIDLDPRFIKLLYQHGDMRTVGLYMDHIRRQVYSILDTQQVDIFGSTPALLQSLAPEMKERGYRFSGMMYGGTQLTKDLYHLLRTEFFPEAVHTAVYGNTLMGGAVLAPPQPGEEDEIVYYPMEPVVKLDLVDPEHPEQTVGMGQTGRVMLTVLSEERFIPRMLERDQAERWRELEVLESEGVANVRSLESQHKAMAAGVY